MESACCSPFSGFRTFKHWNIPRVSGRTPPAKGETYTLRFPTCSPADYSFRWFLPHLSIVNIKIDLSPTWQNFCWDQHSLWNTALGVYVGRCTILNWALRFLELQNDLRMGRLGDGSIVWGKWVPVHCSKRNLGGHPMQSQITYDWVGTVFLLTFYCKGRRGKRGKKWVLVWCEF